MKHHRLSLGAVCIAVAFGGGPCHAHDDDDLVDTRFGTNGHTSWGFAGTRYDHARHVAPDATGSWVVGETATGTDPNTTYRLTLSRLDPDGDPVTTFGTGGHLHTTLQGIPLRWHRGGVRQRVRVSARHCENPKHLIANEGSPCARVVSATRVACRARSS